MAVTMLGVKENERKGRGWGKKQKAVICFCEKIDGI